MAYPGFKEQKEPVQRDMSACIRMVLMVLVMCVAAMLDSTGTEVGDTCPGGAPRMGQL